MKLYTEKHMMATEDMRLVGANLRDLSDHLNDLSEGVHAIKQLKKFGKTFSSEGDTALAELTLETILEQVGIKLEGDDYLSVAKECRGFIKDHLSTKTKELHDLTLEMFSGAISTSKVFVKRYKKVMKMPKLKNILGTCLANYNDQGDDVPAIGSNIVTHCDGFALEDYSVVGNDSGQFTSGTLTIRGNGTVSYDTGDVTWSSMEASSDDVVQSLKVAVNAMSKVDEVSTDIKDLIKEHKSKKLSAEHLTALNVHVSAARDAIASAINITDSLSILGA